MNVDNYENGNKWDESTSREFIDYGQYFIPDRKHQMQWMAGLTADLVQPASFVELCCGEGLLSELLLEIYPGSTVHAYDGSSEMLKRARNRLSRFGDRFQWEVFDLTSTSWRKPRYPVNAVLSSLAIHHLTGPQKKALYLDIYRMLAPGGLLVIADLIEVLDTAGKRLAAKEWDEDVRSKSLELDATNHMFDIFTKENWNIHHYLDPEDIDKPSPLFDQLKWLENAGFTGVDVYWLYAGHAIFAGRKPSNH
jgi:tRNA (cmo5U34)-methyltransferase